MWFLELAQSAELTLGALCLALFVGRSPIIVSLRVNALASLTVFLSLGAMHWGVKDVLSMTDLSLMSLIITGLVISLGVVLKLRWLLLYSIAYASLYGVSAYELLFHKMELGLLISCVVYFSAVLLVVGYVLHRFQYKPVKIAARVLASWISAAGILMLAFFI